MVYCVILLRIYTTALGFKFLAVEAARRELS